MAISSYTFTDSLGEHKALKGITREQGKRRYNVIFFGLSPRDTNVGFIQQSKIPRVPA